MSTTTTTLTCILCPMSCSLELVVEDNRVIKVSGNGCKLGPPYAEKELINPTRILTTTVKIDGARISRLPVKTDKEIPKAVVFECMKEISRIRIKAPVYSGEVVLENVAGTGVNVVATRDLL
ncbi:MAG: DUF1667 domain-containing protein [Bacillota bacterium]